MIDTQYKYISFPDQYPESKGSTIANNLLWAQLYNLLYGT